MAVTLRRGTSKSEITADCPIGATLGDMVWVSANRIAGIYQVDLSDIDVANRRPVGMVATKSAPTRCTVHIRGIIEGIYTGLTPGRPVFLGTGTGARLVQIPPGHPSTGKRYHQMAGMALASNVVDLQMQQPLVLLP